jgi:hypothetical protein
MIAHFANDGTLGVRRASMRFNKPLASFIIPRVDMGSRQTSAYDLEVSDSPVGNILLILPTFSARGTGHAGIPRGSRLQDVCSLVGAASI